jgi:SAM-dependent methyltransferase
MLTIDRKLLGIQEGDQVLDVGCGAGRHSWGMYNQIDCLIYALDIEEENLKKTWYTFYLMDEQEKRSGKWLAIRGDALNLPFKDASFDKIVCSEVLEHLQDDGRGMKEMVRVLKDNGILAVSVPTYLTETIYWKISKDYCNSPGGHVRKYRARELISLLRRNNLRIYAIRHKHGLHSIYWLLRCLFGLKKEKAPIPFLYYKFLVWDMKANYKLFRLVEGILNVLFPKSVVIYTCKGGLPKRQGQK